MCLKVTEKKIAKKVQQVHEHLAQIIVPGTGDQMCKIALLSHSTRLSSFNIN